MIWLRRLPGYRRSPPGTEVKVLRGLPAATVWATALSLLSIVAQRAFDAGPFLEAVWRPGDILAVAVLILAWTVALTVGIAAAIVWIMKGPAYVADAYPLADSDRPGGPVRQQTQIGLLDR